MSLTGLSDILGQLLTVLCSNKKKTPTYIQIYSLNQVKLLPSSVYSYRLKMEPAVNNSLSEEIWHTNKLSDKSHIGLIYQECRKEMSSLISLMSGLSILTVSVWPMSALDKWIWGIEAGSYLKCQYISNRHFLKLSTIICVWQFF